MSRILSKSALRTINRMGDIMLPKTDEFPSFSETGCIEYIDDIIVFAPKEDISGLNAVLVVFSVFPDSILKWIINKMHNSQTNDGALGFIFRQLDFGIKGIIYTCYYSGKTGSNYIGKNPLDVIDFRFNRVIN